MEFQDKTLECVECGNSFIFSAEEQEIFANKGFMNEPKRCTTCRESRRQRSMSIRGGTDGYQRQRKMYAAVCASCGKDTEVPFEPQEGRPVYCSACYAKVRR
ncbi:MAG: zinc-ribbon domain containing protein [Chloroflexota bacterium]|nr:zinc-ribbon domain containing protein [Chloroflexota bacterium]